MGQHQAPRRRVWLPAALAVACAAGGGGLLAHVHGYRAHAAAAGHALVRQATAQQARAQAGASATGCAPTPAAAAPGAVYGVLDVPALQLVAPIVQGVAEAQLSVAVGHLPASVWPGTPGTAVLAAHDVTWFTRISQLAVGSRFTVRAGCAEQTYQVTGQRVVAKDSPLRQGNRPQVVLETCWPTDALYWTNQRLLVFATLVGSRQTVALRPPVVTATNPYLDPAVGAAAAAAPGFPQGTLTVTGDPATGWLQSDEPLLVARAAIADVQAGLTATARRDAPLWAHVAPGRPLPPGGADALGAGTRIDVTETVAGATLRGVEVVVQAPLAPASAVRLTASRGVLRVVAW